MRAPPDAQKITSGSLPLRAASAARAIFSPTAAPMLPIRKRLSITASTTGAPHTRPMAATAASASPVRRRCTASFSS